MKISVALCEGVHDIAYIAKILYANNYSDYNKKISDYPHPINKLFEINFKKEIIGDKKLGVFSDTFLLPSVSIIKDDNLVLLHNLKGDSTTEERYKVIDQYNRLKFSKADFISEMTSNLEFEYLLFYDADELEVAGRIEFIQDKFCDKYSVDRENIEHGIKTSNESFTIGCYVFHDKDSKKGTLEDELIALMRINNSPIFNMAESFVNDNELDSNRTKKYRVLDDHYKGSSNFKMQKSTIGIAGQLQFSGSSNSVIIANSDFIKKADVLNCSRCNTIFKLFG